MKGGPTDFNMITPEEYFKIAGKPSLEKLRKRARTRFLCEVCGSLPTWRLADTGMCFSCTTGESDASGDYELIAT